MDKLYVPALRGVFGNRFYYSCLMPTKVVAERINFAKELHKNEKLSELIQREINIKRGVEIAKYLLTQKERFFNSLVVAVYGGEPSWHEFNIQSRNREISIEDVPDYALHSFGFLSFTNDEKLFAIDGQHRLAGIKKAEKQKNLPDDVSVILIGHKRTARGLESTRRLFTTLNKTAIAVSKGERIALDENDIMAIIVRRLVEDNSDFGGERISYTATNNLKVNDVNSLTTIGNLYDVVGIFFTKILKIGSLKKLQFLRPEDDKLEDYYNQTCDLFRLLKKNIPELRKYFNSSNYSIVTKKNRGDLGGSLVFRPLGLKILMEVIAILANKYELEDAIKLAASLPRELSKEPFANILWNTSGKVIITKKQVLARKLMLYMLNEMNGITKLKEEYAIALGKNVNNIRLPKQIY